MKFLSLFFMLIPVYAIGQNMDCTKFKEGKFKVIDPKTQAVCIITRSGEKQNEKMENAEESYDFDIKWIDNCTYTVSPTANSIQKNKDLLKAGTMTVKIIQVKDSSYVHKISVANNPKFTRKDEVFLISDK